MMTFKITGRIREKESGLGVRGLIIRAYDRDLLFDDLLGTAVTNPEGAFEIAYTEKDFRELFEKKPDVYLSLYAPPLRPLLDTKDAVRWGAKPHEHFELEIDRKTLGDLAPTRPDDEVEGGIALPKDAVRIEKRAGFDLPRLPRFATLGRPGAPALPEQMQYVALPLGGDVLSLEVLPGAAVRLPGPVNPFPAQELVPDVGTDPEQFGDGFSVKNVTVPFTPLDEKYFESGAAYPQNLVQLLKVEETGALQIAAVRVRPVQYDPREKVYLFYPNLRYVVKFDLERAKRRGEAPQRKEARLGRIQAERMTTLLDSDLVVSARDLHLAVPYFFEDVPHVILTDNYTWPESIELSDGTTRPPLLSERGPALTGDVVAEMERLAKWRTSCGTRSRVVTISDVVAGKLGDFTEGGFARDLPEVLRNFVKHAHQNWDTLSVLLAGDVNAVPMRRLAGCNTYETIGCWRVAGNPPPERTCHVVAGKSAVKLYPLFMPLSGDPLSTLNGGLRIPFDREAGSGRLGWYFTSEADFNAKDEGFKRLPPEQTSRYVIVEGPAALLDDDYYWLRDVNAIPSDFYYSSLIGPAYSIPGKHDFDSNNNEIYGQSRWDPATGHEVSLDGVDFWPDVWVGRASVETAAEARAFVDKILTYERLEESSTGAAVDTSYLQKVLYAADCWGRKWQDRQSDATAPPLEGMFTHENGSNLTKVHTELDQTLTPGVPSYRLVARFATTDVVIPYNTSAGAASLGWYFTTSDSYATQSPTPTRFVKVAGPEAEIAPQCFFWDPLGLELALSEKENLRGLMNGWYPEFGSVERYCADYFDLAAPPPFAPLETAAINTAMDNGVHFLSLSGHGWPGGCCGVSSEHDFTNQQKYFIAFANSCSTARPDGTDSLAEKCTCDPDGGAIAYVGNTRYGWIGVGDNFEEVFWGKLRYGSLGLAAGLRLATGGVTSLWTLYTQTLFGDPETAVWTAMPRTQEVSCPESVAWGGTVNVTVRSLGSPVSGHRVTLMGGWTDSSKKPAVYMTKTTNAFGQASFTLPSGGTAPDEILLTVTNHNFKPYQRAIEVATVEEVVLLPIGKAGAPEPEAVVAR